MKKILYPILCTLLTLLTQTTTLFAQYETAAKNMALMSKTTFSGNDLSDVWGYADELGNEYALLGVDSGLYLVDVTNPSTPIKKKLFRTQISIWHDVEVWNDFAYVVNETGGGLMIIDLRPLPASTNLPVTYFTNPLGTYNLQKGHTINITDGFAYINGGSLSGIAIFNLSNPTNPVEISKYTAKGYVHDCEVRGNKLYAAHINNGYCTIVDITNKANVNNPSSLLAEFLTPRTFSHNIDISADGSHVFTTDERSNTHNYITSYNITNLANIQRKDSVQSNWGTRSVAHNVTILPNDFMAASNYKDGVTIWDAKRPHNIVQVGRYDTNPLAGLNFDGVWAVYPSLPSGNWLASDISEGLFVIKPTLKCACYLEGTITDAVTGNVVQDVLVSFVGLPQSKFDDSKANGTYATGYWDAGSYQVKYSKSPYLDVIKTVNLNTCVVTNLNVRMSTTPLGIELAEQKVFVNEQNQAQLTWQTWNETNNRGFEIQRTMSLEDDSKIEKIGFIEGKNQAANYQFIDQKTPTGMVFYRLVQEDFDGTKSVLNWNKVELGNAFSMIFYPNPSKMNGLIDVSILFPSSQLNQTVAFVVADVLGRKIYEVQKDKTNKNFQVNLHELGIPSGLYMVKIIGSNNSLLASQKLVIY